MKRFLLKTAPFSADTIPEMLEEHGISVNRYAEEYFSHPRFLDGFSEKMTVAVASLGEMGFENGAALDEIFRRLPKIGLKPCCPAAGLLLRLEWTDQPQSRNNVLSGTHSSPDSAVTVLSEILEQSDDFPKGLYLRNVDGRLWLRGYICDNEYRFPPDAQFAFGTD